MIAARRAPTARRAGLLVIDPTMAAFSAAAYPWGMTCPTFARRFRRALGRATALGLLAWLATSGSAGAQSRYSVVSWYDEFDGQVVDPTRWAYDIGTGSQFGLVGWGNNELQYYTDRTTNARVTNGLLEITARRETFGGMPYTSARLTTRGTFSQAGGRFEMRASLPLGQGLWPAFWMLPATDAYGGWAASGEIDILEARGQNPGSIENTIHYGGSWPNNTSSGQAYTLPAGGSIAQFHTYAVEWDLAPTPSLRWYVDDRLSWSTTQWWTTGAAYPAPFDRPFHMLLNLAVGGNFVGSPDGSTQFPASMKVDYVRVYDTTPANLVVNVASGSRTQLQEGLGRILSVDSLRKTGSGELVLDAANPFGGTTRVEAGRLLVTHPLGLENSDVTVAAGGTLAASGSTILSAASTTLAGGTLDVDWLAVGADVGIGRLAVGNGVIAGSPALAVTAGGSLQLARDRTTTVAVASLAVDEVAGGVVDLGAGRLAVAAGGTTPTGLLRDLLAGRGDGSWNGLSGITSSVAAQAATNTRAVGYTMGQDGSATVAFAAPGDVDLNGFVDLVDLLAVQGSGTYGNAVPATWSQGDFNYDGSTDLLDLLAVLGSGTYDQGNYLLPTGLSGASASAAAAHAVCEPSLAAGSIGLAGALLLGRLGRHGRRPWRGSRAFGQWPAASLISGRPTAAGGEKLSLA